MALILPATARVAVPWKNGGGRTWEIAADPPGSTLEDFDWRVSTAEVAVAGPFSVFPGIERTLLVLEGRLRLAIGERPPLTVTPESAPVEFLGDVPAHGEPLGGAVADLNVMTRRGRCRAQVTRYAADAAGSMALDAATTLVVALAPLRLRVGGVGFELARLDAVRVDGAASCAVAPRDGAGPRAPEPAACCLIALSRLD